MHPDLPWARQNQGEAERKEVMKLITKLKWERTGDSDWCLVFAKGIFTGMSVAGIKYDKSCEYYICFCQGVRIGACTNLDEAKADIENRVKELAEENWPTEK